MFLTLLAASQAWTDSIGIAFAFFILLPALVTGLVIVTKVAANSEKREDEKAAGRWGRAAKRTDQ